MENGERLWQNKACDIAFRYSYAHVSQQLSWRFDNKIKICFKVEELSQNYAIVTVTTMKIMYPTLIGLLRVKDIRFWLINSLCNITIKVYFPLTLCEV